MGEPRDTVILDYGMGNLFSLSRGIERAGGRAAVSSDPEAVVSAARIVLPGVGAFGDGIDNLRARGLDAALREAVDAGVPLLGICLGMQLLAKEGEEFGLHAGLDLVPGRVVRFRDPAEGEEPFKVPHVGWSAMCVPGVGSPEEWRGSVLEGSADGAFMYFVHSYFFRPGDPRDVLAETVYGGQRFCSALRRGEVFGCQFHPELSGGAGLSIMRRFLARERRGAGVAPAPGDEE